MVDFFMFFLIYILISVFIYFIGGLFVSIFLNKTNVPIHEPDDFSAYSMPTGFVVLTLLIAVISCGYKTLYLIPFVILLIAVFYKRFKINFSLYRNSIRITFFQFCLAFFVFFYNYLIYYRNDGFLFCDLRFYGKIGEHLLQNGIESTNTLYLHFFKDNFNLYHFSDLWLTSLFSSLFNLPGVSVLVYVVYPFLHLTTLFIVIYLFKGYFKKSRFWSILIAIGVLYGSKYFFSFSSSNELIGQVPTFRGFPSSMLYNKLLPIYVLLLYSFLLYRNRLKNFSYLILSMVPVFYSTTIPSILGIAIYIIIVEVINFYYAKKTSFKDVITSVIPFLTVLIIFFVSKYQKNSTVPGGFFVYNLKTYLIFFIETFVKVFFESIPLIFLFIYVFFKYKFQILSRFWILLSLIGIFFGFIYVYIHPRGVLNLDQALSNISPILVLIIFIELILVYLPKINRFLVIFLVLIGVMNLTFHLRNKDLYVYKKQVPTLSSEFVSKVENYYKFHDFKINACSIWSHPPLSVYPVWNFDSENEFQDLFNKRNMNLPLELGFLGFEKVNSSNFNLNFYKNHPFFQEYKYANIKNVVSFLKHKNVNALFISDSSLVSKKILKYYFRLYKDEFSKKSFWVLKNNH